MSNPLTIQTTVHFGRGGRGGRKQLRHGPEPRTPVVGRVPRVARLMALAIRFEGLLGSGALADYAELAHLAHVSRARITQIMNLRLLAPEVQEAILFLPVTENGRDSIQLHRLQPIALMPDWKGQTASWHDLVADRA